LTRTVHIRRLAVLVGAAVALIGVTAPSNADAATSCTKYAAPTGSDSNTGTLTSPMRTPQALVNSLTAGQTGCLRAGTYALSTMLKFPRAGASGSPITLASYPGERAKLTSGYVYVPSGSNFVTISDLAIDGTDSSQNAIQIHAADTVVERNDIANRTRAVTFGNLRSCIHAGSNAGYGQAVRPIIRLNTFHDCGDPANGNKDHSIYYENVSGGQTVDNVFWNTAAFAIHLYPNANNHLVAHNVIDTSGQSGVIFAGEGSLTSSNNIVEKNIITYNRNYGITTYWGGSVGSGNVGRSNCFYGNSYGDTGSMTGWSASSNVDADPKFVNRTGHDYRLATGSGCLSVVGYDTAAKIAGSTPTQPTPGDTTPPETTITSGPSGTVSESAASIAFSSSEGGSTFECRLDGAAWAACTSPWARDGLADGQHTFEVRAKDASGNVDASPASRTWTVQAPVPTDDDTGPSLSWTTPTANGSVTGQLDEASGNCRVDASDASGVERVEFYLDGKLLNVERSAPWSCVWNTTTSTKARHSLAAVAWDTLGNVTSKSIRVTVK
jgi:Bacterial Ig domain/Disaggregatase related